MIPSIEIKTKKDKSPSKKLRDIIFLYWRDVVSTNEGFETFYEKQIGGIIEQYKSKLPK